MATEAPVLPRRSPLQRCRRPPLVAALHAKGMAMGTVLAFMMSVTALSLPERVLLRRVLKVRLIAIWAAVVTVSIVFVGLLFNFIL